MNYALWVRVWSEHFFFHSVLLFRKVIGLNSVVQPDCHVYEVIIIFIIYKLIIQLI